MFTLYLDRRDMRLSLEGECVVLREPERRPQSIPLSYLERVVMTGRVALDSAVLGALGQHGIGVQCLGAGRGRSRGYLVGPGHGDARRRLAQYALVSDLPRRLEWSRGLVRAKLYAQQALLAVALERRPDRRKTLHDAVLTLEGVRRAAVEAKDLEELRGLEGAGAGAYFPAYARLFPASLGCTGRNRRPPRDPVNSALSLGYTLLHNDAVQMIHRAGLDPLLGFFHEPALGRESLACDLIELLRSRVDEWVWWMFRERELREYHFETVDGAVLLRKDGRSVYFQAYMGESKVFRRYLRMQAYRLAKALLAGAPEIGEGEWEE